MITRAESWLFVLGVLVLAHWLALYRWYSLLVHHATPYFAFEKVPGRFDSPILRATLWLFLGLAFLYLAGYWLIRAVPVLSAAGKLAILALMIGPGVVNIGIFPVGALDVFNYLAYLKLTYHYGQNPYLALFEWYMPDPFGTSGFLLHVPLFYGPAWVLLSGAPALLAGFHDPIRFLVVLKGFNLALLGLTAAAVYHHQPDERRGWLAAYTFLANPLVIFEGVGNAHNDVLMTTFLVAAVLALKQRSWLAAPLLVVSALVKFFTAVLFPLFLLIMLLQRWGKRKLAASALLSLVVAALLCAPFWADGQLVVGLMRGTTASQEMAHVSLSSLAGQYFRAQPEHAGTLHHLRRIAGGLFAAGALLVLGGVWRGREYEPAMADTLLLFTLFLTLLYPWYLIPAIALLALKHDALGLAFLFAISALGLLYYPAYVWIWFNAGAPELRGHLFLARFLTLPIVIYLALELGRAALKAVASVVSNRLA